MAPRKKITNVKTIKINFLDALKSMTKWINRRNRSVEELEFNIKKYQLDNGFVKRFLSYFYTCPYLIWYYNKYINDKYRFDKLDVSKLIQSIIHIVDMNNAKKLFYLKSNEFKEQSRNDFNKLIKEYFDKVYNVFCTDEELDIYFDLFNLDIISDEDIMIVDKLLNNTSTVKIEKTESIEIDEADNAGPTIIDSTNNKLNETLLEFSNEIKMNSRNRIECQSCSMFGRPMVTFDTNKTEFGEVDIVFIGLNPGLEETKADKPFVGDSGKMLRNDLINLIETDHKNWVITNSILCSSANKNEIPNFDDVQNRCKNLCFSICSKFPSKIYVPIGNDALKLFPQIENKITTVSGKIFDINGCKIIPLIHPSGVLRNRNEMMPIFTRSCEQILKELGIQKKQAIPNQNTKSEVIMKSKYNIDPKHIISEPTDELALLDIKELDGNNIMYIFTDPNGDKKYIFKPHELPIYIKYGDYTTSNITNGNFDAVCYINGGRKYRINKMIRESLSELKENN